MTNVNRNNDRNNDRNTSHNNRGNFRQTRPINETFITTVSSSNATGEKLFDISQRKYDGKWNLWVKRTPVELGIVSYQEFNEACQPFWMTSPMDVVVQVYDSRPTTTEVMRFLFKKTS